jgi:tellurite resistance protein
MFIPYGTTYYAKVRGSKLNEVACENCAAVYLYQVERQGKGSGFSLFWLNNRGAQRKASSQAEATLHKALARAVDPVACPGCGWFQTSMCKLLKRKRMRIALWIGLPIALILVLWGLIEWAEQAGDATPVLGAAGAVAAGTVFFGLLWSAMHNPNGGHGGPGSTNPLAASKSRGTTKAEFAAAQAQASQEWEASFHRCLLQSMLHMAAADGSIDDTELEGVRNVFHQVSGDDLPIEVLRTEATEQTIGKDELLDRVKRFSAELSDDAKGLFIRAGIAIAAADDEVSDSEWELLLAFGQALGMSQLQFDAVMEAMKAK